jgi:hypothetical protein
MRMIPIESLDRTRAHIIKVDLVYFADKVKQFEALLETARQYFDVTVKYKNGTTEPEDVILLEQKGNNETHNK